MTKLKAGRVWEVDFLRGVALLNMIIFHLLWDLTEFYGYPFDYKQGFIFWLGKITALTFILVSGISSYLSKNNSRRGWQILLIALGISLVTYIYDPKTFIVFGILHFLGVSILLYPLFKSLNKVVLFLLGTLVIALGQFFLLNIDFPGNVLAPLGLKSSNFDSLDYYPLFPYLGVYLYGIMLGKMLYPRKKSSFDFTLPPNPVSYVGRHTLVIYLVHQPLILVVLYLLSKMKLL